MNSLVMHKLRALLERLTQAQKVSLAIVTAVAIFSLIMLLVWANRPEYSLLYSNLDAADTAKIIDDLRANSMPYKLEDGGSTIFVNKKDVYELRIKYAGQDLISTGAVGYELFDNNNLGLTDFMQKINLKRALEGELSNTINKIESVQQSRIHLVLPERALFEEQQIPATASVVLKLKAHHSLDAKQISGIANLIAASVEGLQMEDVTIVDTRGRALTRKKDRDDEIGQTASQYELQQNIESHLSGKAQSMLDRVLGDNNSIVRVAAQLNFEKVSRAIEKVDPDNSAILSQELNEETSTNTDTSLYKRENTITNYELNKTVEHFEGSVGDIKLLSVAVFVNGVYQDETQSNVPRSDEEITKITDIVKNAVGFTATRGDQMTVEQLAFDRSFIDEENEVMTSIAKEEKVMGYAKMALFVIGILAVLYAIRSVFKNLGLDEFLKRQRELLLFDTQDKTLENSAERREELRKKRLIEDARAKQELQERVGTEVREFTSSEQERASRILRYWLVEEE